VCSTSQERIPAWLPIKSPTRLSPIRRWTKTRDTHSRRLVETLGAHTYTRDTRAPGIERKKRNIRRHAWRAISFEPSPASKVRHARKYACLPFHRVSVHARAADSIGLQHELGIKGHRAKASLRARTREKKGSRGREGAGREGEMVERWGHTLERPTWTCVPWWTGGPADYFVSEFDRAYRRLPPPPPTSTPSPLRSLLTRVPTLWCTYYGM